MTKKILTSALICFLILLFGMFTLFSSLCFAFPVYMANKFEDVGMNSFAFVCFDRKYRNTKEIDKQYNMFLKAIDASLDLKTVYYGDRLINNDDFDVFSFALSLDNQIKTQDYISKNPSLSDDAKKRIIISNYNEKNYIQNQYIKALIKCNKSYLAREFIFDDIKKIVLNGQFSAYTCVSLLDFVSSCEISKAEIDQLEMFYTQFNLNYVKDIDFNDLGNRDLVVLQRMFDVAFAIGIVYEKQGNQALATSWQANATMHKEAIYG